MANQFVLMETTSESNSSLGLSLQEKETEVAKNYVKQRREKAAKQSQDEKNGISKAATSERQWNEMNSYRYAIL